MTHLNKLNSEQKDIMGDFMKDHPNLATNLLPNCAQGKATIVRLWNELTNKLNAAGPPVKDAKSWRKVYADQKYQAKKKLAYNKASKRQTGGGPFDEMYITPAEENIIEASGIEASVEGLSTVRTFGNGASTSRSEPFPENNDISEVFSAILSEDSDQENVPPPPKKQRKKSDTKMVLIEKTLEVAKEHKLGMEDKFDRLLEIQERLLKIKEEKHTIYLKVQEIELEIKKKELELLNSRI